MARARVPRAREPEHPKVRERPKGGVPEGLRAEEGLVVGGHRLRPGLKPRT